MTQNSQQVLNYMKKNYGKEMSKQDIAKALGISVPAVTGTMNSLLKKGYATTTREEIVEDSPATETRKAQTHKVMYHALTETGLSYDPVAEAEAKAAEHEAEKARKAAERAAAKAAM